MNAPASVAHTAPPAEKVLLREDAEGIATLTLNRPRARNSLSEALLAALGEELANIAADRSIRTIIIRASGPVFSAGHDLKELTARRSDPDRGRAYFKQVMDACSAVMQMIVRVPQPVIASVEGVATAAGCQLVASCDLAVAAQDSRFQTPGVHIGLFCSTPMVALSRNVARKHAMEMLLTGDLISADDAQRMGLINRIAAPGKAYDEALAMARKIASKSSAIIKIGKEAFYRQVEMDLADAYAYAAEVMTENMMARDAEEGIGAFIEKREPRWGDR
ncbi:MAG: enoyl-CoA hydratase [Rhizobiales bacterium]|nr:enoyl-CoA hydratase [Hyphomicrobiales bacterium]